MAATGVSVHDDAINEFNDMKLKRIKAKFIIYKIDGPNIISEQQSESDDFDTFLAALPPDDCRYAIYDMDFETNDGRPGNKLVMVAWSPDTAKVKSKMVYAGSKDAMSRAMVGISTKVTATDMSELTKEIIVDACKKF